MRRGLFIIILILSSIGSILSSLVSYGIPYPLVSTRSFQSCEKGQQSQSQQGEKILQGMSQTIDKLTVYGWYKLLGNLNQDYILFSGVNGVGSTIFTLSYNPTTLLIRAQNLDGIVRTQDLSTIYISSIYSKWIFLRVGIDLNTSNLFFIHYILQYYQSNGIQQISEQFDGNSPSLPFDNTQFQLFYGQKSYFPFSSGCSETKKVNLLVGMANSKLDSITKQQDPQEYLQNPELRLQLNFSYSTSLIMTILNIAQANPGYVQIETSYTSITAYNTYKFLDYLNFGEYNFERNNGVFFQFEFQEYQSCTHVNSTLVYFETINLNRSPFVFFILNYYKGCISASFNPSSGSSTTCYTFDATVFNRITVILSIQFEIVILQLYVNNILTQLTQYPYTEIGQFQVQIQNFHTPAYFHGVNGLTSRRIYLKQIKLYEGNYFYQDSLCTMQMGNGSQNDCNMCILNTNYLVQGKQQVCQSTTCPTNYSVIDITNTCEWSDKSVCPIVGQFKLFSTTCSCPDGKYLKSGQCLNCPEYCKTCLNETQCIQQYSSKRINGVCPNNIFDDGKHCISEFMKIPDRYNALGNLSYNNKYCNKKSPYNYKSKTYSINNSLFEIGLETNAFFLSFTFNFVSQLQLYKSTSYTLCFMLDNKNHIFSLTIHVVQTLPTLLLELRLTFFNNLIFKMPIDYAKNIWLGLFTDLQQVAVILKQQNAPYSYYSSKINNIQTTILTNPTFYLAGEVSPQVITDYPFCGNIVNNSYFILEGDYSMLQNLRTLSLQSYDDMKILLKYNLLNSYNGLILDDLTFSEQLYFTGPQLTYSFLNGTQYNNLDTLTLSLNALQVPQFAISFIFTPISQSQAYTLASIQSDNQVYLISFRILANNFNQFSDFNICVYDLCKTLSYAHITYNEPNYIFIRISIEQYNGVEVIEFHTVINYKLEIVTIEKNLSSDFYNPKYLQIGFPDTQLTPYLYYLNNLSIYQGGFYYLDYDNIDPCFLYITRINMECAHPKKRYAFNNGVLVSSDLCNQGRNLTDTLFFYNPFTFSCQDSGVKINNCVLISYLDVNLCLQCSQSMMNLANNCECPDGWYFNETLQSCDLCDRNCATCKDSKTNCITCLNSQSIPPLCLCSQPNQYFDSNNICQQCSPQCASCSESADNCLECSSNRVYLPDCICDPKNFLSGPLIQIQSQCVPIVCDFQCLTCEYTSNNCTKCRGNRQIAPFCSCEENYYEGNPLQQNCLTCQSHYYYEGVSAICKECNYTCKTCSGGGTINCKTCYEGFILTKNNECICPPSTLLYYESSIDQLLCLDYFDVHYSIILKDDVYYLQLNFDQTIDNFQTIISSRSIDTIVNARINEIPNDVVSFVNPIIQSPSQLLVQVQINRSFSSNSIYAYIQDSQLFKNIQNRKILNPIYEIKPYQLKIGQYMFVIDKQNQDAINTLKWATIEDNIYFQIMRDLQFIFYILNSIQPTALFLLVKIRIPINFYYFLRSIVTFVFKIVPEYQEPNLVDPSDFEFSLLKDYSSLTELDNFDRVGFRDIFLLNSGLIFMKYAFLTLIICYLVYQISFGIEVNSFTKKRNLLTLSVFRLSQENEVNILFLILSTCIQFDNIFASYSISRWNIYANFLALLIFLISNFLIFLLFNKCKNVDEHKQYDHIVSKLEGTRVKSQFIIKNYYFINNVKKIIFLCSIYFLYSYPLVVCCIGVLVNLITIIMTICFKPYENILVTILKIIGDIMLLGTWIFMIIFYQFQSKYNYQREANTDEVNQFLAEGFYASVCLFVFNVIYLLLFIYEIVIAIYRKIKNKQKPNAILLIKIKDTLYQKRGNLLNNSRKGLHDTSLLDETFLTNRVKGQRMSQPVH